MNNVWTSIAFRAPCAARQLPRRPLLQLFNGYARSISSYNGRPVSRHGSISSHLGSETKGNTFSTSSILSAKANRKSAMKTSKARPASKSTPNSQQPNSVSKTEGVPRAGTLKDTNVNTEALEAEGLQEVLTWRDYDPVGGMPLPTGELDEAQISGIFAGSKIDVDTGNYILSVMYWRRQSGALIDQGLEFPADSGVTRDQALQGLNYVRSLDPGLDEQAAGQVWANEETLRLQETLRQRAVKIGLYKADPEDEGLEEAPAPEESDQGTAYGRERNKDSQLVKLREENIRKHKAEEATRKAKQEAEELSAFRRHRGPLELDGGVSPPTGVAKYEPGGIAIRPQTKGWLQPVERKDWVKHYEKEAMVTQDEAPRDMPIYQRLTPSLLFLLATLYATTWLSENYTPPPKSARIYPDTPPSVVTVAALTGALFAGFILGRFPPLWKTWNKFCTIVPAYPYAVSMVGTVFNHQPFSHLFANAISLIAFGLILHEDVGRGTFLAIFFASGAVGGFTALTYNVLRRNFTTYVFGSSGAVLGVAAAAIVVRPERRLKVWGYEIPVAMWLLFAMYGTMQVVVAARGLMPGIDHAGHIGGLVAGSAAAVWLRGKASVEREGRQGPVQAKLGVEGA